MGHEIFGERFLGRDKPAWHILGQVFDLNREISVTDAVVEAGCGYRLEKIRIPDLEAFGKPIGVPLFAVFREPTSDDPNPCYLGTVSEDHELLDNLGIARILDPIGKHWPVETVGALRKGDSFFVTLKIGRSVLNGSDAVDRYFLVNGNHANGKGVRITVSTVRVVCANTLAFNLDSATTSLSLRHTTGVDGELAAAVALIARMEKADAEVVARLEQLASTRVTKAQVDRIINEAYPEEGETGRIRVAKEARDVGLMTVSMKDAIQTWELRREAVLRQKAMAWQCYGKLCQDFPDIANTAWAAVNAVTEVENHRVGLDGSAASILFGHRGRTMDRALRMAVEVAKRGERVGTSLRRVNAIG